MKKFLLTSGLLFFSLLSLQSQTFIITQVDKAPVIADCEDNFSNKDCFEESLKIFVQNTIDIRNLDLGENGKAYVQFEITQDGKIKNVRVRATDVKLQKETRRIIEKVKIKEPARKDGAAVTLLHTIPVTFNNILVGQKTGTGVNLPPDYKDADQPPVFKECISTEDNRACFENTAVQ